MHDEGGEEMPIPPAGGVATPIPGVGGESGDEGPVPGIGGERGDDGHVPPSSSVSSQSGSSSTDESEPERDNPPAVPAPIDGQDDPENTQSAAVRSARTGLLVYKGTKPVGVIKMVGHVFEATCFLHHACKRHRTSKPSTSTTRAHQGRPLGFLGAWLRKGVKWKSKRKHFKVSHNPSVEHRRVARAKLRASLGSDAFFAFEREKRSGEPSEPEGFM